MISITAFFTLALALSDPGIIIPTYGPFIVSNSGIGLMKIAIFLCLILSAVACRNIESLDPTTFCGVEDPANELEWLQTEIQKYESPSPHMDVYLYTAVYNNDTIFYFEICCPACGLAPPEVRNCNGESLGRLGSDVNPDGLSGKQLLWKTSNGVCSRD